MSSGLLLALNGAILMGCAVFITAEYIYILTGLMLFLPFLDKSLDLRALFKYEYAWLSILLLLFTIGITINRQTEIEVALSTLILTALPEEWFFRNYALVKVNAFLRSRLTYVGTHWSEWLANISVSTVFALMHLPTQGFFGLMTFFPSLLFGWIFIRSRDIWLVIIIHFLSNIVYISYLKDIFRG